MMTFRRPFPGGAGGIPLSTLTNGPFGRSATDTDLICLWKGWNFLCTSAAGRMPKEPLAGYTAYGTRMVTAYGFSLDGRVPQSAFCTQVGPAAWSGLFVVPPDKKRAGSQAGGSPPGSVGIRILRTLGEGWSEKIRLEGYGVVPRRVLLELTWAAPLDDVAPALERRGESGWSGGSRGLVPTQRRSGSLRSLHYQRDFGRRRRAPTPELRRLLGAAAPRDGLPVVRGLTASVEWAGPARAKVTVHTGRISRVRVAVRLRRGEAFEMGLRFSPEIDGICVPAPAVPAVGPLSLDGTESGEGTRIACGNPAVELILRQARSDVESLKLGLEGPESGGRGAGPVLLAGIPRYVGVFTRDALISAHLATLNSAAHLEAAISRVAAYQGVRWDPWRDEEPGRLHHERRLDPKSERGERNRELYYGDTTGTLFWIHALAEAYRWSGDRSLLLRHEDTLGRATAWLLRKLADGQGLIYYESHSSEGNRNQGWKDSDDAIVDGAGRVLEPPLATVELQGYAHLALLEAASIGEALHDPGRSRELRLVAERVKRRFNDIFWDPARRFYVLGVDGRGRKADCVASNPAHCLGTGIVDAGRARMLVRRLAAPDMDSGWGIRTLSSENPAYDPFSYHRGSVWPVDNALIARNLRIAGDSALADRLIGGQFAAATCFPRMRLPETLSGHARSARDPIPGLYPRSNLLQAWSVTAVFSFVQTMLGLRARADRSQLLVDPKLPSWVPWMELRGLQVGGTRLDLRFSREPSGRSRWENIGRATGIRIVHRPTRSVVDASA